MQTQGFRFSFTPLPGFFSPFLHSTVLYRSLSSIQPCGVVPASSHKVSRVSWYSGSCRACSAFGYGAFTLYGRPSQVRSPSIAGSLVQSEPRGARTPVWALPVPLAATPGIDVSFFSSGYLDVSVRRVPSACLWIQHAAAEVSSAGFPHSDIHGSLAVCASPWLFAAYRVFLRLLVPRHPPCALLCLTPAFLLSTLSRLAWRYSSSFISALLFSQMSHISYSDMIS